MNPTTWEERAEALWQLLDDIDTADDACRENDQAFRERTRTLIQRRFAILSSDGYKLSIPEGQKADRTALCLICGLTQDEHAHVKARVNYKLHEFKEPNEPT